MSDESSSLVSKSKFLKDDFRYVLFSQMGSENQTTISKKKMYAIIENAIEVYAKRGVLASSLKEVSNKSKIPRATVAHYFATVEDLNLSIFKYIRYLYQAYVLEAIGDETRPAIIFEKYFYASVSWPHQFPQHAQAWVAFLHMTQHNSKYLDLNSESTRIGFERLLALVLQGRTQGVFKVENPERTTRAIHLLITGLIISESTEKNPFLLQQREEMFQVCRALLDGSTTFKA